MDTTSIRATGLWLVVMGGLVYQKTAVAQDRPIVAVFEMEDRGADISKKVRENLSTYLMTLLTEANYQVIPQAQIRDRLREQQKDSYKECYDQKCQIELGRELAAQKTLAVQIIKVGEQCQLMAMLYDLKKAATEKAANASGRCDEPALQATIKTIAIELGAISRHPTASQSPLPCHQEVPYQAPRTKTAR